MMKNLRDSYKMYKAEANSPVNLQTYNKITSEFMKFIMDKVFEGFEVKLPVRMGSFQIIGRKVNPKINSKGDIINLAPDWVKTKALWEENPEAKLKKELVFCFNEHTDGIRYKFLWSKKNMNVANKGIYSIRFSRENKRRIYSSVKQGKEYMVTIN